MQRVGDWGYAIAHWEALRAQALDALAAWHRRAPDSVGPPESRLLEGSGLRLPREVLAALADALLREAAIVREGAGLRLAGHRLQLSGADDALWRETSALLERSGLRPPSVAELAAALGTDARKLDAALSRLERHGLLVRVSKTRFFPPPRGAGRRGSAGERRDHRGGVPRPRRHRSQPDHRGAGVLRPDKIHPPQGRRACPAARDARKRIAPRWGAWTSNPVRGVRRPWWVRLPLFSAI
jgi:hypothetical protein